MVKLWFYGVVVTVAVVANSNAEEVIELQKDAVVGNREAPKALYIVPWRPMAPTDVTGLQIETLLDEELEFINPESFKRKISLHEVVSSDTTKK